MELCCVLLLWGSKALSNFGNIILKQADKSVALGWLYDVMLYFSACFSRSPYSSNEQWSFHDGSLSRGAELGAITETDVFTFNMYALQPHFKNTKLT